MAKKFTYEYVKSYIEVDDGRGYRLLSKNYVDISSKLEIMCPSHGRFSITLASFRSGRGCAKCGYMSIGEKLRLSYDYVKNYIEKNDKRGYILLSKTYVKNSKNLEIICPTHGNFYASFDAIRSGRGCKKCGCKSVGDSLRFSYKKVEEIVKEMGYVLVSKKYINARHKIKMLCPIHGEFTSTFGSVRSGHGCSRCGRDIGANKHRLSYSHVEGIVRSRGYTLISKEYKTANSKIDMLCPSHGKFSMTFASMQYGSGCSKCSKSGFNPNKSGILYYLCVVYRNRTYYKIGITNLTVRKRYSIKDFKKIRIIDEWEMRGQECWDKEKEILIAHSDFKYRGNAKVLSSGNTELFTRDVLNLDN